MQAWDHHNQGDGAGLPLDLADYEAIGTLRHALSRHAEEAFAELPTARDRRIAETMFKALTDKSPEGHGVRRPSQIREICSLAEAREEEVISVIERFRLPERSFLMPPAEVPLAAETVIDISHESLMRTWERLIAWVDEETGSAQQYLRLVRAAERFAVGEGDLWRDPELQLALKWHEKAQPTAVWAARYSAKFDRAIDFLRRSEQAREAEEAEKERARQKELRRTRQMFIAAVLVALVTLSLALVAWFQSTLAEEQRAEAVRQTGIAEEQRKLAEEKEAEARKQQARAEINAEEARHHQRLAEKNALETLQQRRVAEKNAAEALRQEEVAERNAVEARRQQQIAEEKEEEATRQKQLAESSADKARKQQEIAEAAEEKALRLRVLELTRSLAIQTLRMQEEPQLSARLAVAAYRLHCAHGGDPNDAEFYEALLRGWQTLVPAEERADVLERLAEPVRTVAVAPGGHTVAYGSDGDGLWLAEPGSGQAPRRLAVLGGEEEAIRAVSWSPSGRWLAAGTFAGSVFVWDRGNESTSPIRLGEPGVVEDATGGAPEVPAISALLFTAEDALIAGSLGGDVWRLNPGQPGTGVVLASGSYRVLGLASNNKGTLAAAVGQEGILLWDAGKETTPRSLAAGRDVRAIAFDRGGRILAAGEHDGAIILWDVIQGTEGARLLGHRASVNALSFSPIRDLLASASSDRTVRLWDMTRSDAEPLTLDDHRSWVWAVAFSPDGELLVSGGSDQMVRLWSTRGEPLAQKICDLGLAEPSDDEWNRYLGSDVDRLLACPAGLRYPSGINELVQD